MSLQKQKPTSPGRRFKVKVITQGLHKGKPYSKLVAKKTKSGLAYKVLTAGKGNNPKATDTVEVHYTGWTTDGKMFDSSVLRKRTATFPLSGVIAGWTEGVQLMKPGAKYRFWIPEELAYKGRPGAPQGVLVFDVELITIR